MKCRKLFLYFASCLLFVSAFTSFTFSPNTSAVSDLVFHLDASSVDSSLTFCDNGSCSYYHYLYADWSFDGLYNDSYYTPSYNVAGRTPGGWNFNIPIHLFDCVYILDPSNITILWYGSLSSYNRFPEDWSLTLTLSENNPFASGGITPSGSITLTENGTFDVTNYAEAVVDVPAVVEQGDYHDDLVSINNSIVIGCAVPLVIYFFYAIYKMLLGGSKG